MGRWGSHSDFEFPNSKRPHTQTSASTPRPARPLLLPTEMQDLDDLGLKEAEGSSAIFSENLNLEAWEGQQRGRQSGQSREDTGGSGGGQATPRAQGTKENRGRGGTNHIPLGDNSRRTSSGSHPCPPPLAPVTVAVEDTCLKSSVR